MACRFCLDPAQPRNPFVSPCDCKGSGEFVHRRCLQRWRDMAPHQAHQCMVCLADFRIPIAWPLEIVPAYTNNALGRILNNPFVMIISTYYLHLLILTHVPVPIQYLEARPKSMLDTETVLTLKTEYINSVYMLILSLSSLVYVSQWIFYFGYVRNKTKYLKYCVCSRVNSFPLYVVSAFFAYASAHLVFPFGAFYLLTLPIYMRQHQHVLMAMNEDAENLLSE